MMDKSADEYFNRLDEKFDIKNVDQLITYLGNRENVSNLLKVIATVSDTSFKRGFDACESKYQNNSIVIMSKDEYERTLKTIDEDAKTNLMHALNYIADHSSYIILKTESGIELKTVEECIFYLSADEIIEQVAKLEKLEADMSGHRGEIISPIYEIGDELEFINKAANSSRVLISKIGFDGENTYFNCIGTDGEAYEEIAPHTVRKTGRNFRSLLEAIMNIEEEAR